MAKISASPQMQLRVLEGLVAHGKLSATHLARQLNVTEQACSNAFRRLRERGAVRIAGRRTLAGLPWEVTDAAPAVLEALRNPAAAVVVEPEPVKPVAKKSAPALAELERWIAAADRTHDLCDGQGYTIERQGADHVRVRCYCTLNPASRRKVRAEDFVSTTLHPLVEASAYAMGHF